MCPPEPWMVAVIAAFVVCWATWTVVGLTQLNAQRRRLNEARVEIHRAAEQIRSLL